MKIKVLFCVLIIFWLSGCHSDNRSPELTVFAAASLTDAFTDLSDAFKAQNPDVEVRLHVAGSAQLAAQLRGGARADIFASANAMQMQDVIDADRIELGTEATFASNRLIIIVPKDNPANIMRLEDLAQKDTQIVLAAQDVPIRTYADQIIATLSADLQTSIYENLVSEEANVRQVTAKVALGEADAGIVYLTDMTPDFAQRVQQIELPPEKNVTATYPIGVLSDTSAFELAQRFVEFTLSDEGQAILSQWGFGPPNGD